MKKYYHLLLATLFFLMINSKKSTAQCPYDNTLYFIAAAPATVGSSVYTTVAYAGDIFRVTGMIAGNTYQISTCTSDSFDTQLSIYTAGGGLAEGYNDDFCGAQSLIYFTPIVSGSYDILLDEYNCTHNSINMDLTVELIRTPRPVITIPVVVHVVYNNATENITNAQIQSQIDVLNADFRRYNTDIYNAPAVFRGASYDPLIEFCLAQRDPDGFATNGITRTYTSVTDFSVFCNPPICIFEDTLGGEDAWDKTQYLNIWICDLQGSTGTLNGIAFPVNPLLSPILQGIGVIIDYRAIGTTGTAIAPYNKGRTGTHEIGHWLGLWHLWYQNGNIGVCESDSVFDTPLQDEPFFGCPLFPQLDVCSTSWPGIMFNNHMDYTDDACKNMFTIGQSERMEAMLFGPYLTHQTSQGCTPCPNINASFSASAISICQGQTINFTNTSTGAITYQWRDGATLFSTSVNASRTFNTVGTFTIDLIATNDCIDTASITITVNPLPANAGAISGTTTVCQGQNAVTYTVPTIANATSYIWTLPSGASGTSTTNSITVNYGTSAISGNITVKGTNSCGNGTTSTSVITVNPLPANAGSISGTTTVCQGQNAVTYTVPTIANATSYIWSLPSGVSGTSTTNSITVNYGTSAISGNITVKGTNSCGNGTTSTLVITVNPLPANAGSISGTTTVCQGQNAVTYTVPTIANATSYIWTLPSGASGTSTTNSITVNYGTSAISGNITVKGTNSCGNGTTSTLVITVNSTPTTPIISLTGNDLQSNSATGNQWYDQNGLISGATNQNYTATVNGNYYVIVTLLGCSSDASNTINVILTSTDVVENSRTIKIYPNPVSNELIIEIEGNNVLQKYEILNAIGQVILKGEIIDRAIVQTNHFTSGVYFVKLENGKTFEFKKIIKE